MKLVQRFEKLSIEEGWWGGGIMGNVFESLNLSADSKLKTEWHPPHTHMNSLTVLFSILLFLSSVCKYRLCFESVNVLVLLYREVYTDVKVSDLGID